jgi:hypothetical protein
MSGVLCRTTNYVSHQRHRKYAGLGDRVPCLAVADESAIRVAEAMIYLHVKRVFRHRALGIEKKVIGSRRARDVWRRVFLIKIKNVRAGSIHIAQGNEIVRVRKSGYGVLDDLLISREVVTRGR